MITALPIALSLIKKWEGCHLEAYKDIVGIPTIGWGETKGVKMGDKWTQQQADEQLEKRVLEFMAGVEKACPRLLLESPSKLAACTSLAYNIGLTAFANSTVCRKLMQGDIQGAGDAILMWNKAGGKVVKGLVNRREDERKVFFSGK